MEPKLPNSVVQFAALVAVVLVAASCGSKKTVTCDYMCTAQAESSAIWYALNELDCDEADYGGGACQDELQDLNGVPRIERITQKGHYTIFLVMVRLKNGVPSRQAETVNDLTGQVVNVDHRPA